MGSGVVPVFRAVPGEVVHDEDRNLRFLSAKKRMAPGDGVNAGAELSAT
jgi:hypothetical protein